MDRSTVILREDEYIHLVDGETGAMRLIEGPTRVLVRSHEKWDGKKHEKKVLRENEFVTILNPFDETQGGYRFGELCQRCGPAMFALYPFEKFFSGIERGFVLNQDEYIVVTALCDTSDKLHRAGERWIVRGPTRFVPSVEVSCSAACKAINVGQNEGIYVRDTSSSELRLIRGPCSYVLSVNEELYEKSLSNIEYKALKKAAVPSFLAYSLTLEKNQAVCIVDVQKNSERYEIGPCQILLEPTEHFKVITIAAGVPKKDGLMPIAFVRLGPDFMNDSFSVRTKDNALLEVRVMYKWRFLLGNYSKNPENLARIFQHDFVGYACQSLRSRIREAAARYNFEDFHGKPADILRQNIFKTKVLKNLGEDGSDIEIRGRYFTETGLLVFDVDVQDILPVDPEIARLLGENLKKNTAILCQKTKDAAEMQAEIERIESQSEIARLRRDLISLQNVNYEKKTLESARISGQASVEASRAEVASYSIREKAVVEAEAEAMRESVLFLATPSGQKYMELQKIRAFSSVKHATVVPRSLGTLILGSEAGISPLVSK